MTAIEIHLDGKPVTKLQAARACANIAGSVNYPVLPIGRPDDSGWISSGVVVRGRRRDMDGMQPAFVSFPAIGSVPATEARAFAEAVTLGAEVAELAEMIAAEQVTEYISDSRADVIAPCMKPEVHATVPDGKRVHCDRLEHHAQAASLVGTIVCDAHDDSPCPVTGKVVRQVDEEHVEVLWGDLQFWPNPGPGTREPVDALRLARQQAEA